MIFWSLHWTLACKWLDLARKWVLLRISHNIRLQIAQWVKSWTYWAMHWDDLQNCFVQPLSPFLWNLHKQPYIYQNMLMSTTQKSWTRIWHSNGAIKPREIGFVLKSSLRHVDLLASEESPGNVQEVDAIEGEVVGTCDIGRHGHIEKFPSQLVSIGESKFFVEVAVTTIITRCHQRPPSICHQFSKKKHWVRPWIHTVGNSEI